MDARTLAGITNWEGGDGARSRCRSNSNDIVAMCPSRRTKFRESAHCNRQAQRLQRASGVVTSRVRKQWLSVNNSIAAQHRHNPIRNRFDRSEPLQPHPSSFNDFTDIQQIHLTTATVRAVNRYERSPVVTLRVSVTSPLSTIGRRRGEVPEVNSPTAGHVIEVNCLTRRFFIRSHRAKRARFLYRCSR